MEDESLEDLVRKLQSENNNGDNTPGFGSRDISQEKKFGSKYNDKNQDRFGSELLLHQLRVEDVKKILKKGK